MCSIVYYRFDRSSLIRDTSVTAVYAACGLNKHCMLNATVTNTSLPIATLSNPLHSDINCVVNFVEIIHDCMPRCVDLNLDFIAYPDGKLHLQV